MCNTTTENHNPLMYAKSVNERTLLWRTNLPKRAVKEYVQQICRFVDFQMHAKWPNGRRQFTTENPYAMLGLTNKTMKSWNPIQQRLRPSRLEIVAAGISGQPIRYQSDILLARSSSDCCLLEVHLLAISHLAQKSFWCQTCTIKSEAIPIC